MRTRNSNTGRRAERTHAQSRFRLMMASRMIVHIWSVTAVSGGGLKNRRQRHRPQCRSEDQNQRRYNAKRKKRKQNGQGKAEYIRRLACNQIHEPSRDETRRGGDHAASAGDLQTRMAMRALHTVRERHDKSRRNGVSAVRAHSIGHDSPREKHTKISQRAAKEKRGIK
jgi:hypothetical protein